MRVTQLHVVVYTYDGVYTEPQMSVPDTFRADYYWLPFSRTYSGVQRIEVYVDLRRVGDVNSTKYLVRIRDLCFY